MSNLRNQNILNRSVWQAINRRNPAAPTTNPEAVPEPDFSASGTLEINFGYRNATGIGEIKNFPKPKIYVDNRKALTPHHKLYYTFRCPHYLPATATPFPPELNNLLTALRTAPFDDSFLLHHLAILSPTRKIRFFNDIQVRGEQPSPSQKNAYTTAIWQLGNRDWLAKLETDRANNFYVAASPKTCCDTVSLLYQTAICPRDVGFPMGTRKN